MPGSGELLILAAIALIALGPKQLPEVARFVGRLLSEFRRASSDFQRALSEAADAKELEEMKKQIAETVSPVSQQIQQFQTDLHSQLEGSVHQAQQTLHPPAPNPTPEEPKALDEDRQLGFDLEKKEH